MATYGQSEVPCTAFSIPASHARLHTRRYIWTTDTGWDALTFHDCGLLDVSQDQEVGSEDSNVATILILLPLEAAIALSRQAAAWEDTFARDIRVQRLAAASGLNQQRCALTTAQGEPHCESIDYQDTAHLTSNIETASSRSCLVDDTSTGRGLLSRLDGPVPWRISLVE